MISATDVPACPACGSREVHPVRGRDDRTLYACRQCGRDNTDAWRDIQPPRTPKPIIGAPEEKLELADPPDPLTLGIGAELRAVAGFPVFQLREGDT